MRYRAIIAAAMLAGPAIGQEATTPPEGLDRPECAGLLALSQRMKEETKIMAWGMQGAVLEAHGPLAVERDPTQPLVDALTAAWDAYRVALRDLCRDTP